MNKKKKFFVALMLALPVIVFALGIVSISPSNASALPGAYNVSVPIILSNNDSVAVLEFQVNHTQYLIFRGAENTTRTQNATIESNEISPTVVSVAAFVPGNISAGDGAIMNLIFDVNESATPGNYTIGMSDVLLTNVDIDNMSSTSSDSLFTVI